MLFAATYLLDAKAEARQLLRTLGFSAEPIAEERLMSTMPQTRVRFRGYEVILQDDHRFTTFRNLGSADRRRVLYERDVKLKLSLENERKILVAARAIAEKIARGSSKWQLGFRAAGSRRPRMFGEGWGVATVTFAQAAYGYKTNGCGNSLIMQFDQADLSVASLTLRSGWTYRKPKIKISKQRAIELSQKRLRFKTAPTSADLAYAVPTWAFGKDRRRNNYECVLGYTCVWKGGMATVDAETGEFIAGSRLF